MSQAIATRGYAAAFFAGGGGGGGGSGASGISIPFSLTDNNGNAAAGVTLTASGVLQVSIFGAAYADALGTVTEIGDGDYFYTLDVDEIADPWVLLKISKTGYYGDNPRTIVWNIDPSPSLGDISAQITNAVTTILGAILNGGEIAAAVWNAMRASYVTAGTFGGDPMPSNVTQWLGDAPAALTATNKLVQVAVERWLTDNAGGTPLALVSGKVQSIGDPDFNSDDRAALQGLRTDYTTARAGKLDHLDEDISAVEASVDNAAVAAAVLGTVIEGSVTVGDALRGIISALVCRVGDFTTGTLTFKSLNGTKTRWTITTDATGRLSVTPGDLT